MKGKTPNPIVLSVVTPLTKMAGRLHRLEKWLPEIENFPIQVILVHDRQDHNTGPELEALNATLSHSKIQIIENFFGSPGIARNRGLELATGEWICFWDSDDLPDLKAVISIIQRFSDTKSDCFITNFNSISEISHEVIENQIRMNYEEELGMKPGLWRIIFKHSAIGNLQFCSLQMAEDQIFLSEFFSTRRNITITSEVTYSYFYGSNNHLTKKQKALNDLGLAAKETLKILSKSHPVSSNLIAIMFVKQIISGVKFGSFGIKNIVAFQFIKSIFVTSLPVSLAVIRNMAKIFIIKVREFND